MLKWEKLHQDLFGKNGEVKSSDYVTPECVNFVGGVDVSLRIQMYV